jgi:hypothetical protein
MAERLEVEQVLSDSAASFWLKDTLSVLPWPAIL